LLALRDELHENFASVSLPPEVERMRERLRNFGHPDRRAACSSRTARCAVTSSAAWIFWPTFPNSASAAS
jgi:hypothetical protein